MTATALCLVGDVRSGTTVLQGLLSQHPDVDAVGELRRLQTFVHEGRPCACGATVTECARWPRVAERLGVPLQSLETGRPSGRIRQRAEEAVGLAGVLTGATGIDLLLGRRIEVAHTLGRLLAASAEEARTRVVVDSSKDPGHAVLLLHQNVIPVFVCFTIRDGRAVVWSKMRRTGIGVVAATRHWLWVMRATRMLHRALPAERKMSLRHEELCRAPRASIEALGAWLGLDPALFDTATGRVRHDIGGSPGLAEFRFDAVRLDQSWRSEMPSDALAEFERIGGRMNRALGYT